MTRVALRLVCMALLGCHSTTPPPKSASTFTTFPGVTTSKFQEEIRAIPLEEGATPLWGPVGKTLQERFYGVWEFDAPREGEDHVFYLFSPGFVMHTVVANPYAAADIRFTPGFWAVEAADGHIGSLLVYAEDRNGVTKISFEFTDPNEMNLDGRHFLRTGLTPNELIPYLTNPWSI